MADILWTAKQLAEITGGRIIGNEGAGVSGFSIDSRTLEEGDAYVAIKGDVHDGHKFASAALKSGAVLAIVSKHDDEMQAAGTLLVVNEDPLQALEKIARASRDRFTGRVAAITGSVGKTGTKEMLRMCLAKSGKVHASIKSYNNHWGVPLMLANLPMDADFGVFEVGMNHPGEIVPLVGMIKPEVAIITTVAPVHLGMFHSVDEIADAKAEIFTGVRPGGTAILNLDNAYFDHLKKAAENCGIEHFVSFGEASEADVHLTKTVLHDSCSCVQANVAGDAVTYKIGAPGRHFVQNSLAVLAAVKCLDADLTMAVLALAGVSAPVGRGERSVLQVPGGSITLIDEAYNANPTSVAAALAVLGSSKPGKGGRRISVLGDMLELGEKSAQLHAELITSVDEASVDRVYACGSMMKHLWDALNPTQQAAHTETSEGLKDFLLRDIRAGDVVMIKGSLGSKMLPLVSAIKERFPEVTKEHG
ncbi:MAG: UDP-N-acetylmuramoylalanyl-D-glutamyl-2,6-diaminopimelate--D-alanyl-D-alanine ligase [Hyphomicrobiales bacterium]